MQNDYWIAQSALTISLNAMGDHRRIIATAAPNAKVLVFRRDKEGLDYGIDHDYRRWPLTAFPTIFSDDRDKYVHIAIPKPNTVEQKAVVVFPSYELDIDGYADIPTGEKNSDGSDVTERRHIGNDNFYYVYLYGVILAPQGGVRKWRNEQTPFLTGTLSTDSAYDAGPIETDWYRYAADTVVDDRHGLVTFKKDLELLTDKNGKPQIAFQNFRIGDALILWNKAKNCLEVSNIVTNRPAHLALTGDVVTFGRINEDEPTPPGGVTSFAALSEVVRAGALTKEPKVWGWDGSKFTWMQPGQGGGYSGSKYISVADDTITLDYNTLLNDLDDVYAKKGEGGSIPDIDDIRSNANAGAKAWEKVEDVDFSTFLKTTDNLYWANINVKKSSDTNTQPQFGKVGIGAAPSNEYSLYVNGKGLFENTLYTKNIYPVNELSELGGDDGGTIRQFKAMYTQRIRANGNSDLYITQQNTGYGISFYTNNQQRLNIDKSGVVNNYYFNGANSLLWLRMQDREIHLGRNIAGGGSYGRIYWDADDNSFVFHGNIKTTGDLVTFSGLGQEGIGTIDNLTISKELTVGKILPVGEKVTIGSPMNVTGSIQVGTNSSAISDIKVSGNYLYLTVGAQKYRINITTFSGSY